MKEQPKFLVRLRDYHIFEIDESNNCYRSYSTREVTRPDGTRPEAQDHFTLELLTSNGFFAIKKKEIPKFEKRHDLYVSYTVWSSRSDGHGGTKEEIEDYQRLQRSGERSPFACIHCEREFDYKALLCKYGPEGLIELADKLKAIAIANTINNN